MVDGGFGRWENHPAGTPGTNAQDRNTACPGKGKLPPRLDFMRLSALPMAKTLFRAPAADEAGVDSPWRETVFTGLPASDRPGPAPRGMDP